MSLKPYNIHTIIVNHSAEGTYLKLTHGNCGGVLRRTMNKSIIGQMQCCECYCEIYWPAFYDALIAKNELLQTKVFYQYKRALIFRDKEFEYMDSLSYKEIISVKKRLALYSNVIGSNIADKKDITIMVTRIKSPGYQRVFLDQVPLFHAECGNVKLITAHYPVRYLPWLRHSV